MLELQGLDADYGNVKVLESVTMRIGKGELVGLLGANNAGNSTLMNCISGIVTPAAGRILFEGDDITKMPPQQRVERGIVQVPEGRLVFPHMSVYENLLMGGINATAKPNRAREIEHVLTPVSYTHLDVYKRQNKSWEG